MNSLHALLVATAILVAIPGPNVALIVANAVRYGIRAGVLTVVGTTLGVALQLLLVVAGLAAVIELAVDALVWIKWAGVLYLVALGIRTWREPARDLAAIAASPALFWRGCLVASINPKTLLFNAAFIPQFVPAAKASVAELALVSSLFLAVLLLGDLLWVLFASSARRWLARHLNWHNRVSGAFLALAGIGLALARRP